MLTVASSHTGVANCVGKLWRNRLLRDLWRRRPNGNRAPCCFRRCCDIEPCGRPQSHHRYECGNICLFSFFLAFAATLVWRVALLSAFFGRVNKSAIHPVRAGVSVCVRACVYVSGLTSSVAGVLLALITPLLVWLAVFKNAPAWPRCSYVYSAVGVERDAVLSSSLVPPLAHAAFLCFMGCFLRLVGSVPC